MFGIGRPSHLETRRTRLYCTRAGTASATRPGTCGLVRHAKKSCRVPCRARVRRLLSEAFGGKRERQVMSIDRLRELIPPPQVPAHVPSPSDWRAVEAE